MSSQSSFIYYVLDGDIPPPMIYWVFWQVEDEREWVNGELMFPGQRFPFDGKLVDQNSS